MPKYPYGVLFRSASRHESQALCFRSLQHVTNKAAKHRHELFFVVLLLEKRAHAMCRSDTERLESAKLIIVIDTTIVLVVSEKIVVVIITVWLIER